MTQEELYEQWQRYMHRADLDADMPQVYDYAASKTINRMMAKDITIGDIMALQPQMTWAWTGHRICLKTRQRITRCVKAWKILRPHLRK